MWKILTALGIAGRKSKTAARRLGEAAKERSWTGSQERMSSDRPSLPTHQVEDVVVQGQNVRGKGRHSATSFPTQKCQYSICK